MISVRARLTKTCPGPVARLALDDATLTVRAGTVHAVVGENGAGKTTLLRIVYGLARADGGELILDGKPVALARHSPAAAIACGVGLVQQHTVSVPTLTVIENAVLGIEPTRHGQLALKAPARALAAVGDRLGMPVDPWAVASTLSVGGLQRAELVTALWRGARLLLLDEPTAVLTPTEADALLTTLARLRDAGTTVVLVSHRLDEVTRIADAITVLRHGRTVATHARGVSTATLAHDIIGAEVALPSTLVPVAVDAPVVLRVTGLAAGAALHGATLQVVAGELLGVAGVDGNGQDELALAIAGLVPITAGRIELDGHDLGRSSVRARQQRGMAHVPADRHARGLVLTSSLADNLVLGRPDLRPGWWLRPSRMRAQVADALQAMDVRPPEPDALASTLSGGNQQKVVIARELGRPGLRLVVAAQPTRGVDLGAVAAIHERLRAVARTGAAGLVISADLDELLALCHRVVVLLRGRVVGELAGAAMTAPDVRARASILMTGLTTGSMTGGAA